MGQDPSSTPQITFSMQKCLKDWLFLSYMVFFSTNNLYVLQEDHTNHQRMINRRSFNFFLLPFSLFLYPKDFFSILSQDIWKFPQGLYICISMQIPWFSTQSFLGNTYVWQIYIKSFKKREFGNNKQKLLSESFRNILFFLLFHFLLFFYLKFSLDSYSPAAIVHYKMTFNRKSKLKGL